MDNVQFLSRTLASPTGATLHLHWIEAQGTPRGVIHINHGLAEHSARYERFAKALSASGYHVYAQDHRGHGKTTAPDAPLGMFAPKDGVLKVLGDVDIMQDFIKGVHPKLPCILFGHSMGGLIALNYALTNSHQIDGLAVWNTSFSAGLVGYIGKLLLKYERFRLGHDVPSRLAPKLTFQTWAKQIKDAQTPFDWLSHDPKEVQAYIEDPLCGWDASIALWQDLTSMVFNGADDTKLAAMQKALHINIVAGMQDPASDFGKAMEKLNARLHNAKFQNLSCTIYPQTRHEGLNDLKRDEITQDFIEWANKFCPIID